MNWKDFLVECLMFVGYVLCVVAVILVTNIVVSFMFLYL